MYVEPNELNNTSRTSDADRKYAEVLDEVKEAPYSRINQCPNEQGKRYKCKKFKNFKT